MLLSDRDIAAAISTGRLTIDPFHPGMVQPSSLDVRLDRRFIVFDRETHTHIDPAVDQTDMCRTVDVTTGDPFILHPGELALASTLERVTLAPDLAARLEGKSSLGRLGLLTHVTAGFIDPGFTGHITLELVNLSGLPMKLWPGMKIGQLCLFQLSSPALYPYGTTTLGSRYQGQTGPTPSRSHLNFHRATLDPRCSATSPSRFQT